MQRIICALHGPVIFYVAYLVHDSSIMSNISTSETSHDWILMSWENMDCIDVSLLLLSALIRKIGQSGTLWFWWGLSLHCQCLWSNYNLSSRGSRIVQRALAYSFKFTMEGANSINAPIDDNQPSLAKTWTLFMATSNWCSIHGLKF